MQSVRIGASRSADLANLVNSGPGVVYAALCSDRIRRPLTSGGAGDGPVGDRTSGNHNERVDGHGGQMFDWVTQGRLPAAAVTIGTAATVVLAGLAGTGSPAKSLDFRQAGHWVYRHTLGSVFHVDGGTKQVDAKADVGVFDADVNGARVLQGDTQGFVLGPTGALVFGKSTLTVDTTIAVGSGEDPIGLEVRGGPYLVYRNHGTIMRLGVPPTTVQVGGPVAGAVGTDEGSVWVQRADTGDLCFVGRDDDSLQCPARVQPGHKGSLTAVGKNPAYVDVEQGTLTPLDEEKGFGQPVRLGVTVPADVAIAANAAGDRLPLLDRLRDVLVLADVSWVGRAARNVSAPITVDLPRGEFDPPVATADAVALLDRVHRRLYTFDSRGRQRARTRLPGAGVGVRVSRGEDGRVYVDDRTGANTVVVDTDGTATAVSIGGRNLPGDSDKPRRTGPTNTGDPGNGNQGRQGRPERPGAPGTVSARPGNAQISASWEAAPANGARIGRYVVSWAAQGGQGQGGTRQVRGDQLSVTLTGLTNGVPYVVSVAAVNRIGQGPQARSAPVTPSAEVPDPPAQVTATARSDSTVEVSWPEADGQGHAVAQYEISAVSTTGASAVIGTSTTTSAVLPTTAGLDAGTTYTFTVRSISADLLTSEPSRPSNEVTPFGPAGAPGNIAAEPSDGQLTLTWDAPDLAGGELVDYVVSGGGLADQTVTQARAVLSGLTNGTQYSLSVRARTRERNRSDGEVSEGAAASVTARPGTAPAVSLTEATLSGDRQVSATFDVNARGSGTVSCRLLFSGSEKWSGACSGTVQQTVTGLAYGTTYTVSVVATNDFGSVTSGSRSVTTNAAPTIAISKGASAYVKGQCWTSPCAWVVIEAEHFPPSRSFTATCYSTGDTSGWGSHTVKSDADGNITERKNGCVFGYPGEDVWVTINGVTSPHITW